MVDRAKQFNINNGIRILDDKNIEIIHNIKFNNHDTVSTIATLNTFCFSSGILYKNEYFSSLYSKYKLRPALNPSKYPLIGQIIIAERVETLNANVYLFAKRSFAIENRLRKDRQ